MQNKKFAHVLTQVAPSVARTMLQDQNKETFIEKIAEQVPPCEKPSNS